MQSTRHRSRVPGFELSGQHGRQLPPFASLRRPEILVCDARSSASNARVKIETSLASIVTVGNIKTYWRSIVTSFGHGSQRSVQDPRERTTLLLLVREHSKRYSYRSSRPTVSCHGIQATRPGARPLSRACTLRFQTARFVKAVSTLFTHFMS